MATIETSTLLTIMEDSQLVTNQRHSSSLLRCTFRATLTDSILWESTRLTKTMSSLTSSSTVKMDLGVIPTSSATMVVSLSRKAQRSSAATRNHSSDLCASIHLHRLASKRPWPQWALSGISHSLAHSTRRLTGSKSTWSKVKVAKRLIARTMGPVLTQKVQKNQPTTANSINLEWITIEHRARMWQ